jgi:hypothetical protein
MEWLTVLELGILLCESLEALLLFCHGGLRFIDLLGRLIAGLRRS